MLSTDRWLALPALKLEGNSINTTDDDELAAAQDQLLKTKPTLLAYDDTTFYTKLLSRRSVARRAVGRLVQLCDRREPRHQIRDPD